MLVFVFDVKIFFAEVTVIYEVGYVYFPFGFLKSTITHYSQVLFIEFVPRGCS